MLANVLFPLFAVMNFLGTVKGIPFTECPTTCVPKLCTDKAILRGSATLLTYLCPKTPTAFKTARTTVTETTTFTLTVPNVLKSTAAPPPRPIGTSQDHHREETTMSTTTIRRTSTIDVTSMVHRVKPTSRTLTPTPLPPRVFTPRASTSVLPASSLPGPKLVSSSSHTVSEPTVPATTLSETAEPPYPMNTTTVVPPNPTALTLLPLVINLTATSYKYHNTSTSFYNASAPLVRRSDDPSPTPSAAATEPVPTIWVSSSDCDSIKGMLALFDVYPQWRPAPSFFEFPPAHPTNSNSSEGESDSSGAPAPVFASEHCPELAYLLPVMEAYDEAMVQQSKDLKSLVVITYMGMTLIVSMTMYIAWVQMRTDRNADTEEDEGRE